MSARAYAGVSPNEGFFTATRVAVEEVVHRGWKDICKRMGVAKCTLYARANRRDPLPLRHDHRGVYLREADLLRWLDRHRATAQHEVVHGWPAIRAHLGFTRDQWAKRRHQLEAELPHYLSPDGTPVAHRTALDDWMARQDVSHQVHVRIAHLPQRDRERDRQRAKAEAARRAQPEVTRTRPRAKP